jgi:hypothetical protein
MITGTLMPSKDIQGSLFNDEGLKTHNNKLMIAMGAINRS